MRHSLRQFAGFTAVCIALPLLAVVSAPAHAQAPLVTPTPLPAIVATRNAAEVAKANGYQQQQTGAELQRNGAAQVQQANADLSNAEVAAATQNAVSVGMYLGRIQETVNQLEATVNGQAGRITTLLQERDIDKSTIISQTYQIEARDAIIASLKVDKQVIQQNYAAMSAKAQEAEKQGASISPIALIVFVGVATFVSILIVVVLSRKQPPAPPVSSVAYDVGRYDDVNEDEVIDA